MTNITYMLRRGDVNYELDVEFDIHEAEHDVGIMSAYVEHLSSVKLNGTEFPITEAEELQIIETIHDSGVCNEDPDFDDNYF